MKLSVPAALLILLLAGGCGKVGEPRPPSIRTPARVMDLKVTQNQRDVILAWTNPDKYFDGSPATDLANYHVLRNGTEIKSDKISGAGKSQTVTIPGAGDLNTAVIYSVALETKKSKRSAASNEVSFTVVDVPGVVSNLRGEMDQHRIRLDWDPPRENPSLAEVYLVRRNDGVVTPVQETHLEDIAVEVGKDYSYVVTAARGTASSVSGPPGSPVLVHAIDAIAPSAPKGLQPPVVSESGAVLRWTANTEADWAGYWIYRSDNPDTGFVKLNMELHTITSFVDENYKAGSYYSISAQDDSGKESARSSPVRAP